MSTLSVVVSHQPRAPSAVGDWGHEIFHEIDQSLQRSMNIPPPDNTSFNHHTSTLSDASSTYSTARIGHRGSGRQVFIDPKLQLQPRQLDVRLGPEDSVDGREGKRRASDGSGRDDPSVAGSHRNTREFEDFYDSYWRRSGQAQASGNQNLKPTDAAREGRKAAQTGSKRETIRELPSPLPSPSIGRAM